MNIQCDKLYKWGGGVGKGKAWFGKIFRAKSLYVNLEKEKLYIADFC